jgi:hypothetical protein
MTDPGPRNAALQVLVPKLLLPFRFQIGELVTIRYAGGFLGPARIVAATDYEGWPFYEVHIEGGDSAWFPQFRLHSAPAAKPTTEP